MSSNYLLGRAIALAALALGLAGCTQFNEIVANRWRQQNVASRMPTLDSGKTAAPVTAKQRADVQMAVGQSLEQHGDAEGAIKIYNEVVRLDDSRADAYHRLAVLNNKNGDWQQAEKFYTAAIKRDPKRAEAHCDLGYGYYLQQRWKESELSLQKAIELKPDLARAHNNLGLLYARTGFPDKALAEFARAGCKEAEGRSNLAYMLMREHQWGEAQQQFQLALAADPRSQVAHDGLRTLQSVKMQADALQSLGTERGNIRQDPAATYMAAQMVAGQTR
jgi:tetratricopeptide (TPR) repeat protein